MEMTGTKFLRTKLGDSPRDVCRRDRPDDDGVLHQAATATLLTKQNLKEHKYSLVNSASVGPRPLDTTSFGFGCLELLRAVVVTAVAWLGVGAMAAGMTGATTRPLGLMPAEALALAFAGIGAYVYELRGCRVWAAARSDASVRAFLDLLHVMRNAAPLIDFVAPGAASMPHEVTEWLDESRKAEHASQVPRGVFLVSFPLEFLPGDASEAAALEYQRLRACDDGQSPKEDGCLTGSQVGVRLRVQLPSGIAAGEPEPRLLASGAGGEPPLWLQTPVLMICSVCLLGLVAEIALCLTLDPLVWPIRKRFFTIRGGGRLGTIRFTIDTVPRGGRIVLDGVEEELRAAHRFWLRDADWDNLWSEAHLLSSELSLLRRVRRAFCTSGLLAAAAAVMALALDLRLHGDAVCGVLAASGAALSLSLWALASCSGCAASQRAHGSAASLANLLPGGAITAATWSESEVLELTVERRTRDDEGPALLTTALA